MEAISRDPDYPKIIRFHRGNPDFETNQPKINDAGENSSMALKTTNIVDSAEIEEASSRKIVRFDSFKMTP